MIKIFRNKKTIKLVWWGLAIILIPAFVIWGTGGAGGGRKTSGYAGRIFGRRINIREFQDAVIAVRTQALIQFGDKYDEIKDYLNLEGQAWERLILLSEARRRGIKVTDTDVVATIQNYPFFRKDGVFNRKIYEDILEYAFRIQPRIFEEHIRANLVIAGLYKAVAANTMLTDDEVKNEYIRANETVSVSYIVGVPVDYVKDIHPADEDLKNFFPRNSVQFKEPPSCNIIYLMIDSSASLAKISRELRKIRSLLNAARNLNMETKETGLFPLTGSVPGIGWSPELIAVISKLKPGEYSPPVKTDGSYYIIQMKEKKDAYIPEFEAVKDKVKAAYIKEESQRSARRKIETCRAKIEETYKNNPQETNLEEAAKSCGLKSGVTAAFKFGGYIEGIGPSDPFWTAAHDKNTAISAVIEAESGFYIVKTESIVPIDEKKFEEEKETFRATLLARKKERYFAQYLEELKRKAQ